VRTSSLYRGGPGVAHINSALTASLADPTTPTQAIPSGIAYQNVDGTNELAFTDPAEATHTVAGELPLFSGQVTPAQLRQAYGVNQISNLIEAMQQASKLPGVSVVTLSYGEPADAVADSGINEQTLDSDFTTPGVTFLAASGDSGIYGNGGNQIAVNYPSASPNVVSVGGTSIVIDSSGDYPGTGASGEVGWGDGTSSGSDGGSGGGLIPRHRGRQ
jgi:hypothetical protein